MRLTVKTETGLTEPIITLHLPENDPNAAQLRAQLESFLAASMTFTVSQAGHTTQLPLTTVLFFEATGHKVRAHTRTTSYQISQSLASLTTILPTNFCRVSKSAIVNTQLVRALTKSLTGNLIEFEATHKQLYASRRYYRELKLSLEKESFK